MIQRWRPITGGALVNLFTEKTDKNLFIFQKHVIIMSTV